MDERQFRMKCPKCRSYSFTVRRDQRAYVHKSQPFELVFSCRCGKQLFGEQIQNEYDRQKQIYDAGGDQEEEPEPAVDPDLADRRREEERRKDQLRRAMEYRRTYLAEKRRQQTEAERERKEEEDQRWREKVALVGEPTPKSPTTSAAAAASGAMGSRVRPSPSPPILPPRPAPLPPKPQPAPVARAPVPTTPKPKPVQVDGDSEHPHAEFMPYLANGTFVVHFPDATPPDVKDPALCVWPPCEKPRRKKSKYCSRECSNKNARWRHKQRKKS